MYEYYQLLIGIFTLQHIYTDNKTNTLVRSQKRQKKRKRRGSSTKEEEEEEEEEKYDDDDDVKVDDWQRRYFSPGFLNH